MICYTCLNMNRELEYQYTDSYAARVSVSINSKSKSQLQILSEPEYVFADLYNIFSKFRCISESFKCIFFGSLIQEFYMHEKNLRDFSNIDMWHCIHYFYIYIKSDCHVSEFISEYQKCDAYTNIRVLEKYTHKVYADKEYIEIYKIHVDWVDGEWYGYIYQIKDNSENKFHPISSQQNLQIYFKDLNKLSMFSNSNIIYFCNSYYSFDKFNDYSIDNKIPFELISLEYINTIRKDPYQKKIYENIFFVIFEIVYKKYKITLSDCSMNSLGLLTKSSSTNCSICFHEDINSDGIHHLRCCHQHICLDCLLNMFLNCQIYFEKKAVYLLCPFCRGHLTCNYNNFL